QEIHAILDGAMAETRDLLSANRDKLELLTKELVEKETLDDAQIRVLLGFDQIVYPAAEETEQPPVEQPNE
ncbi:MAG: cell division protein FtsH, partial [Sphaerochaeta sp.]